MQKKYKSVITPLNMRKKIRHTERIQQTALVKWARLKNLPLVAIPNGGARSAWEGAKMRAEGLTRGVSDLFLAYPTKTYHGFWIEMKAPGKKPNKEQIDWLILMRSHGYHAEWYDNWEKAKCDIEIYLIGQYIR